MCIWCSGCTETLLHRTWNVLQSQVPVNSFSFVHTNVRCRGAIGSPVRLILTFTGWTVITPGWSWSPCRVQGFSSPNCILSSSSCYHSCGFVSLVPQQPWHSSAPWQPQHSSAFSTLGWCSCCSALLTVSPKTCPTTSACRPTHVLCFSFDFHIVWDAGQAASSTVGVQWRGWWWWRELTECAEECQGGLATAARWRWWRFPILPICLIPEITQWFCTMKSCT